MPKGDKSAKRYITMVLPEEAEQWKRSLATADALLAEEGQAWLPYDVWAPRLRRLLSQAASAGRRGEDGGSGA